MVVLNAAAALVVGGRAETLAEGIAAANESLDSGSAMRVLEHLVDFTQSEGIAQ